MGDTGGEITARELWDRLHGGAAHAFYLLDVRNEEEAARWRPDGALPLTSVNVPYFAFIDDPDAALARVPRDAGEAVVVCAKGDSSAFVKDVLLEAGLPAVNLAGGMLAWGDLHVPVRIPLPREDVELWQVSRYGKGCLSYAIVAGGEAAIVDPSRFVEVYEALARARGARIVEVLDTHVHADHLSGGAALARRSGARYRNPAGEIPGARPLADGEELALGGGAALLRALAAPGHTPESVCFALSTGHLLTGDTIFVSGVGRPDLGGRIEEWGRALHRTLRELTARFPDDTTVLPAHFASAAEADERGAVGTTLGELRRTAPELALRDPEEFVARLRETAKDPPAAYAEIARANRGLVDPGDRASEWELGRNLCAASAAKERRRDAWNASSTPAG